MGWSPNSIHAQGKKDVIAISAEDLGKEFDKSAKAANKKYDGKLLEVTGCRSTARA
jgi:hypothetical protein